jgi:hypothetical protein
MSAKVPTNILIASSPSDTLTACRNVLFFIEDAATEVDLQRQSQTSDGFRWVVMMVREALDYEAERAAARGAA